MHKETTRIGLAAAWLSVALSAAAQVVTVSPAAPAAFDTIRVQVPQGVIASGALNSFNPRETRVSMENNRIPFRSC